MVSSMLYLKYVQGVQIMLNCLSNPLKCAIGVPVVVISEQHKVASPMCRDLLCAILVPQRVPMLLRDLLLHNGFVAACRLTTTLVGFKHSTPLQDLVFSASNGKRKVFAWAAVFDVQLNEGQAEP